MVRAAVLRRKKTSHVVISFWAMALALERALGAPVQGHPMEQKQQRP